MAKQPPIIVKHGLHIFQRICHFVAILCDLLTLIYSHKCLVYDLILCTFFRLYTSLTFSIVYKQMCNFVLSGSHTNALSQQLQIDLISRFLFFSGFKMTDTGKLKVFFIYLGFYITFNTVQVI